MIPPLTPKANCVDRPANVMPDFWRSVRRPPQSPVSVERDQRSQQPSENTESQQICCGTQSPTASATSPAELTCTDACCHPRDNAAAKTQNRIEMRSISLSHSLSDPFMAERLAVIGKLPIDDPRLLDLYTRPSQSARVASSGHAIRPDHATTAHENLDCPSDLCDQHSFPCRLLRNRDTHRVCILK